MKAKHVTFLLSLLVAFPALVGTLFVFWFLGSFGDCTTETDAKIKGPAGVVFDIETSRCTGFPSEVFRSVHAKMRGDLNRTLIFQYHPRDRDPLPTIKVLEPREIVIVAPWVRSSLTRLDHWQGLHIDYRTGEDVDPRVGRRSGK